MNYLLDTNVLSEARRQGGDPRVLAWLRSVQDRRLFVSVLALGEIQRGVHRLRHRDPVQAEVFERWLGELRRRFADRIVAVDVEIAEEWGRMSAVRPIPVEDALMAATAKVREMVFVTRNVAHVSGTGVSLLDPWQPPTPQPG